MFFVSDRQDQRHRLIRSFRLKKQESIAVILAAVDFEWTVRRAILALGIRSTKDIRASLRSASGLDAYKEAWKLEVEPRLKVGLAEIVPSWSVVREAFYCRNRLVHGVVGVISSDSAQNSVESILKGSVALESFAMKHEGTLYRRIVRRKPRKASK